MQDLSDKEIEKVAYNPRSRQSRNLADWWEDHQERDRERIRTELKDKRDKATRQKAVAKLTPYERRLLGL
jgi:hypothetical protein